MSTQDPPPQEAQHSPRARASLALLVLALVTGGLAALAVVLVPPGARIAVGVIAGVAVVLVSISGAIAAYAMQAQRLAQEHADLLESEKTDMIEEANELAYESLPTLVSHLREGASPETALVEVPPANNEAHQRMLRKLAEEIGHGERMRAAAMSACANAAGRVQAITTTMLADLREMEERHGEEVLGDLMKLDHTTAQAGRLADSIAVLTGARSGRRWTKPIVMESVLRGAVGRINAYQRVRVHSTSSLAVMGHAAEGVMHVLAELMDNATSFSPPSEQVHVYVEEVQAGVVVAIEDGGLVMGDLALKRAERAVSSEPLDLTTLSGTRLGLAVVGALARKHGLTVFFRPSSRGGTGVVVMIPRHLITEPKQQSQRQQPEQPQAEQQPAARPQPTPEPRTEQTTSFPGHMNSFPGEQTGAERAGESSPPLSPAPRHQAPDFSSDNPPQPAQPAAANPSPAHAAEAGSNETPVADSNGLPRRRRGETLAAASASAGQRREKPVARPPSDSGAKFGAFRRATRGTLDDAVPPSNNDR